LREDLEVFRRSRDWLHEAGREPTGLQSGDLKRTALGDDGDNEVQVA
jgi:hypothetical protein